MNNIQVAVASLLVHHILLTFKEVSTKIHDTFIKPLTHLVEDRSGCEGGLPHGSPSFCWLNYLKGNLKIKFKFLEFVNLS